MSHSAGCHGYHSWYSQHITVVEILVELFYDSRNFTFQKILRNSFTAVNGQSFVIDCLQTRQVLEIVQYYDYVVSSWLTADYNNSLIIDIVLLFDLWDIKYFLPNNIGPIQ